MTKGLRAARWVGVLLVAGLLVEGAPTALASPPSPGVDDPEPTDLPTLSSPPPSGDAVDAPAGEFSMVPGSGGEPAATGTDEAERLGEVVAARDLVTEAWARGDGSVETVVHGEPINFVDDTGDWVPVDSTLVPDPEQQGAFVNAANGWDVRFSPIEPGGSSGGVEVVTESGELRMAPDAATATIVPVVGSGEDADTVTYAEVWPGVDLVYRVTSVSVKEELVVRQRPKVSEFGFVVEGADLVDQGRGQDVAVEGALGDDLAIAPPEVTDKTGRGVDRQAKPDLSVADTGPDQSRLVVDVDDTWANGLKASAFPIVIDPTVVVNASLLTAYRSDGTSVADGLLRVGNPSTPTPTTWRSVAFYPYQSAIQNKQLLSATLNVSRTSGLASGTTMAIYWANAWSHAGAKAGTALASATGVTDTAAFNLTGFFQARQAQPTWNAALGVIGQETSSYTYKSLSSSVTFVTNNLPPMANASAPSDGAVFTTTKTPRLAVGAVTDPDGTAVKYWFRLATGTDAESGMVLNSGWLTSTTAWNVPAGVLQDGVSYYRHVYTWDSNAPGVTTDPSWVRKLTVDQRLGAGGSSATEQVGPVTVNLGNGNAAVSASTHSVSTLGGAIGLDFSYNSQASSVGLNGAYYNDDGTVTNDFDASDTLVLQRRDPQVNFNWGAKSPAASVAIDRFLARWSGYINVPASVPGVCTACVWKLGERSDDGFRLKLDGSATKVIDQWTTAAIAATPTYTAAAVSNGPHAAVVEYYDAGSLAQVELWAKDTGSGTEFQVPASWLTVAPPALPDGWTLASEAATSDWTSARVGDASVTLTGVDGSSVEFPQQAGAGYAPPAGYDDVLAVTADGSVHVTGEDGTVTVFGPDGNLRSVTSSADGQRSAATQRSVNAAGQLTTLTDPVSQRAVTVIYAPNAACPTAAPDGTTSVPVDGFMCRVSFAGFDGAATDLHYLNGRLAWVVNPGGETTGFGYDTNGALSEILDPLAADAIAAGLRPGDATTRTQIVYSAAKATTVTLPAPATGAPRPQATIAYAQTFNPAGDPNGELVSGTGTVATAGQTGTRVVTYDSRGRVTSDKDPANRSTAWAWDTQDRVVATTGPDGLRSTTIYDPEGRPIEEYGPSPSGWFGADNKPTAANLAATPVTTTAFDEGMYGLATSWWDNVNLAGPPKLFEQLGGGGFDLDWGTGGPTGLGAVDNFSGRFTGEARFIGASPYTFRIYRQNKVRLYVDDQLVIDAWTEATGYTAEGTVPGGDGWHRIRLEMADGSGAASTRIEWKTTGSFITVQSQRTRPRYGLVTSTTDDEGETTATSYSDPTNGIAPQYGLATATTTDPAGQALTETTTYENPATAGTYLRRTGRTLPAGGTTTYGYYGPTETADDPCPGGPTGINQGGQLKTSTDPDPDGPGGDTPIVREQRYDPAGQVIATRIVGDAGWTCTSYDPRGRPTSVAFPAFGGEPARTATNSWAVGANPLVTSVSDPAGTITTSVDLLGRTIGYVDVWGTTSTITYDQAGQMTAQSSPGGAFGYAYNGGGELTQVTRNSQVIANGFVYDTGGRLINVAYPAGTGNAGNGTTGSFGFDPNTGQPTSMTWNGPGASLLTSDAVTRTRGGRIKDQSIDGTDPQAGDNFVYDSAGRLTAAWVPGRAVTYAFAPTGGCGSNTAAGRNTNRTSMTVDGGTPVTYCYDGADRLTSTSEAGVGTIAYDGHGNTTTMFGETRVYDQADRHLETRAAATTVRYIRDATDRIVERKVNGTTVARYGYAATGDVSALTLDTTGAVLDVTISLPGGALQTIKSAGQSWGYPNIHGDLTATADPAGVKQGATVIYDPYGNLVAGAIPDNSTGSMDYGWVGQRQRPLEQQAGLQPVIEMGARQYSPLLGRFVEVDPIEGGVDTNNYGYVRDPVNQFDLTGEGGCPPFLHRKRHNGSHYCKGNAAASVGHAAARPVRATAGWAGRNFSRTGLRHGWNSTRRAREATHRFVRRSCKRTQAGRWIATGLTMRATARAAVRTGAHFAPRLGARAIPVVGWGLLAWDGVCIVA